MVNQAEITQTLQMNNLILRNLRITQTYHDLSQGMAQAIGQDNANWCSFATFASKTAGYAIRHDRMPHAAAIALNRVDVRATARARLRSYLADPTLRLTINNEGLVEAILDSISLNVSIGNGRVFAELAHPFHHFIMNLGQDTTYNENRLHTFLAQFRPGTVAQGGQDYLMEAFAAYYTAKFETNPRRKAQTILLANLLVGLHEQIRLQPYIAEALEAPVAVLRASFGNAVPAPVWQFAQHLGQQMLTQMTLFIATPTGELRLGQNVRPPLGASKFPAHLTAIENMRLRRLLREWDRSDNTLTGTAADNWACLEDRMHFIADFFRSHQQNRHLFQTPFSRPQLSAIQIGQIPMGNL